MDMLIFPAPIHKMGGMLDNFLKIELHASFKILIFSLPRYSMQRKESLMLWNLIFTPQSGNLMMQTELRAGELHVCK